MSIFFIISTANWIMPNLFPLRDDPIHLKGNGQWTSPTIGSQLVRPNWMFRIISWVGSLLGYLPSIIVHASADEQFGSIKRSPQKSQRDPTLEMSLITSSWPWMTTSSFLLWDPATSPALASIFCFFSQVVEEIGCEGFCRHLEFFQIHVVGLWVSVT